MADCDVTIIGAGALGTAVASEIPDKYTTVVIERNPRPGLETSSYNNGVRHSGIYYLPGSNKAWSCVEGGRLLDELAGDPANHIPYNQCGKLVIAASENEIPRLEKLREQGEANGVEGLEIIERRDIQRLEPNIMGAAALWCPSTGLIEPMALMAYYTGKARDNGTIFLYNRRVTGIEKIPGGFHVSLIDAHGEPDSFTTRFLVNCAGLGADRVAAMAGIDVDAASYRQTFSRGSHYDITNSKRWGLINGHLVYPLPPLNPKDGLGTHITFDVDRTQMRLGPDSEDVDPAFVRAYLDGLVTSDEFYRADVKRLKKDAFLRDARGYFPALEPDDIAPGMVGYRTQVRGGDFIICEESKRGLPGMITLLGFESPGLTASPAVARYVAQEFIR